jgi:hypothetical protein
MALSTTLRSRERCRSLRFSWRLETEIRGVRVRMGAATIFGSVLFFGSASTSPLRGDPQSLRTDVAIRRVVEVGPSVVRMDRDPISGDLYLLQSGAIRRVRLDVEIPIVERVHESAEIGVASAQGLAFAPDGTLYVSGNSFDDGWTAGIVRRGVRESADPGSNARSWSTFARSDPYPLGGRLYNHLFGAILVRADGQRIWLCSGSRTDHGEIASRDGRYPGVREVGITSCLLSLPTDSPGGELVLPDDRAELRARNWLFAEGLRNTFDLAFDRSGELFGSENSGDRDDSEELNWLREGHHYGFPWRMGDAVTPMQFAGYDPEADPLIDDGYFAAREGLFHDDPSYPPAPLGIEFSAPIQNSGPDADRFRDPVTGAIRDASDEGSAIGSLTAHRSPLGLAFDTENAIGGVYRGDGFVLSWTSGDADGDDGVGPFFDESEDLLHLELTRNVDAYSMRAHRIARGFRHPVDSVLHGHRLWVVEYHANAAIWELTFPPSESDSPFIRGLVNADDELDLSDGIAVLVHLFAGRPLDCVDAADVDDDGALGVTDAISLLRFLFADGPGPRVPYPDCGVDVSDDELAACREPRGCAL